MLEDLELEDTGNPGSRSHFIDCEDWKLSCSLCEVLSISGLPFSKFSLLWDILSKQVCFLYLLLPTLTPSSPFSFSLSMLSKAVVKLFSSESFSIRRKKALHAVLTFLGFHPPLCTDLVNFHCLLRFLLPLSTCF